MAVFGLVLRDVLKVISNYKYSDMEQKRILKSLIILIDRREKSFNHITNYFDSKKINYKNMALTSGDYSVMLPASPKLGIMRDLYFDKQIFIERKASLEELSGNLAQNRERFEDEFIRARDCRKYLLVEDGSYSDIFANNYSTGLNSAAFAASILSFQQRYDLNVSFVSREHSGKFIHGILYYHLREVIRS